MTAQDMILIIGAIVTGILSIIAALTTMLMTLRSNRKIAERAGKIEEKASKIEEKTTCIEKNTNGHTQALLDHFEDDKREFAKQANVADKIDQVISTTAATHGMINGQREAMEALVVQLRADLAEAAVKTAALEVLHKQAVAKLQPKKPSRKKK